MSDASSVSWEIFVLPATVFIVYYLALLIATNVRERRSKKRKP